jgi:dTDP-L-rhamnose 4-epimerase
MVGVVQSMYQIEKYVDINTKGTAILLDLLVNTDNSIRKLVIASFSTASRDEVLPPHLGLIEMGHFIWTNC